MAKGARTRAGEQYPLFDYGQSYPNGFTYQPNFISVDEEAALRAAIENLDLVQAPFGEYTANRRIQSFGWSYGVGGELMPGEPLPEFLQPLAGRIAAYLGIPRSRIVEALVTEYRPGVGVGWHRDNEQCEKIIGISLAGWCELQLRPVPKKGTKELAGKGPDSLSLTIEPRSIYIMQDESRWNYQHRVVPTKTLRYSITFRTLPA